MICRECIVEQISATLTPIIEDVDCTNRLFLTIVSDLPVPSTMDGEIITQCNLLNAVVGSIPPLMWTAQPKKRVQPEEPDELQFWQIQICPYFLSFATRQPYQWTVYLQPQMWPRVLLNKAVALYAKTKYAPIDALSLMDKVFLHEVR